MNTTMKKETFVFKVAHAVELQYLKDMLITALITAFEGGSNYWIRKVDYSLTKEQIAAEKLANPDFHPLYDWMGMEGAYLTISVSDEGEASDGDEPEVHTLTLDKFVAGVQRALDNSRHTTREFCSEDFDASTADVILQYALFGDVVYG